jgi:hypothetical protein
MNEAEVQIAERGRPLGGPVQVWLNYRLVPFIAAMLMKILTYTLRVRYEAEEPVRPWRPAGSGSSWPSTTGGW